MNYKFALLNQQVAAFGLMLCVGAPSMAQTVDPRGTESSSIDEIVVTATKREEKLQEIPMSITVVDAAQLARQNITAVSDLVISAPGLNSAGPFGALSIRGIGSETFSRSAEGSVGVVLDNVALAGTSANPPQMFDVSRAEVLEGPQGTLFGSDSSAGVINIVTNAPDPSKFEAIGHLDLGTLDTTTAHGVVNVPLSDTAALRISGSYAEAPNVMFNRFADSWARDKNVGGRVRFLWEPNSDLTINEIGDFSRNTAAGGTPWPVYYSTPGSYLSTQLAACGVHVAQDNDSGCTDGGAHSHVDSYGYSSQIDYRIGAYTLTSISAYRGIHENEDAGDVDSVPVYLLNQTQTDTYNNFTQELRIASPTGHFFDYVAGLYYFRSDFYGETTQLGPVLTLFGVPFPLGQVLSTNATTQNYAAFGQGTLNFTSAFRVSLGARYGNSQVNAHTSGILAEGAVAPIASLTPIRDSTSDNHFSYRVGIQYDLSKEFMVYGTYAAGYKGPAVNDQAGGPTIPLLVRPEIPHSGELGFKSTLFDGRLGANLAVFYTRVSDFQAQFFDPDVKEFIFGNAPSLTSKGVEMNVFGQPVKGLTLNLGGNYDNAKYGPGYLVSCAQGQTAAQGCDPTSETADAGGNKLVGTPEYKATASGEYAHSLAASVAGFLQLDAVYTSRINWSQVYDPLLTSAAATIVGTRIGIRTEDHRFGVAIFARNLFDTYRPSTRFETPVAAQLLDPRTYVQISGPESRRVVGISLDARF